MVLYKKLVKILIIFTLIVPLSLHAGWKSKAWTLFVGTVTETIGNILSTAISPSVAGENIDKLKHKVSGLEDKLEEFDIDGNRPENFSEIKQAILGIKTIVIGLDNRVTSLEDKVSSLESRLTAMGNGVPVIKKIISVEDVKKILKRIKPSFKCSKAKKDIELSICQNLILRDIDGRMGKIYWELRNYFPERISKELRLEQLRWLRKRDSKCYAYDEICLVEMYKERIIQLKSRF